MTSGFWIVALIQYETSRADATLKEAV